MIVMDQKVTYLLKGFFLYEDIVW